MKNLNQFHFLKLLIGLLMVPVIFDVPFSQGQEAEQTELKDLEKKIEASQSRSEELKKKASEAAKEGQKISRQLVVVARQIQEQETALTTLEENMSVLTNQIAAKKDDVRLQNRNMAHTLAALQRLSQRPPEYIIMRPAEAVDTVRSASLLTTALPEIEKKTELMRQDLAELNQMKETLLSEQDNHRVALANLLGQTKNLERLQKEKLTLYSGFLEGAGQEEARRKTLAKSAKDMRSLIDKLEEELKRAGPSLLPTPPIPEGASFSKAKGALPYPARGNVIRRFGSKIAVGTAKGISIQSRTGARVIAPFDGRVIFAGKFRTYGNLLIIAHGDGYHTLLAGLNKIDTIVGQWVLAGEPVGIMAQTRLASASGNAMGPAPELYLEIRKDGVPINPLPWLKK